MAVLAVAPTLVTCVCLCVCTHVFTCYVHEYLCSCMWLHVIPLNHMQVVLLHTCLIMHINQSHAVHFADIKYVGEMNM